MPFSRPTCPLSLLHLAVALVTLTFAASSVAATAPTILLFVAQDEVYYSEYIVMRRALEASGYAVEVRSSTDIDATTYLVPAASTLVEQADSLAASSYGEFTARFAARFGTPWHATDDVPPAAGIGVDGRIQEVADLSGYAALVVAGGTGALAYRVDGSYAALGPSAATDVEAASEALNRLALDALARGKPVMAMCHGASLAPFFRIPGTLGPGLEILGYSLLKDSHATGFPEPDTGTILAALDVTHRPGDTLTIASPHPDFYLAGATPGSAESRIVTTRDWYPQNVAHAAAALLNLIDTYPPVEPAPAARKILLLHGGAVDTGNCSPANSLNDVPCNFGIGPDTPADYLDILAALSEAALANEDGFELEVDALNLTPTVEPLPFDPDDEASVRDHLEQYDSVLLFKHWSTGMTDALQRALVDYVDDGGGVLALHHALYNDVRGALDKDILVEALFGLHSPMGTWNGSSLQTQDLLFTQAGHFITSFQLAHRLPVSVGAPAAWSSHPLTAGANPSGQSYHRVPIFDEIYNNWTLLPGSTFGNGVGDLEPLLATTGSPAAYTHFAGYTRRLDASGDGSIGRVAFMMPGERKESFSPSSVYPRLVRNALLWVGRLAAAPALPDSVFGNGFELASAE